jgi:PST family polysaccharide transporter
MSIGRQAAHGVAWYMALGVSSRVVGLIGTLILARFFVRADYGAVITASIVVLTANAFTSFAFGQYLIAKRAPPEVAAQAAIVHIGLGIAATALVYSTRGAIGDLVGAPAMGQYILGYAVAFLLIDRLYNVPERLLMRALNFRALATINGIGEIALTATSLATVTRWGGYSLVIGALARSSIKLVLILAKAPHREWLVRARLRAGDIRDLFLYGLPIMIASVTDNATNKWDNLIVTRLFGPDVMADYNYAYNLADMPISNVAEHIGEVLMPSFSRMEDAQRRAAVVRAAHLMGLIVSPLGVGLGAVAATVVPALFKPSWAGVAPMLTVLGATMVFRPMIWSAIAYAQAVQRTGIVMISSFLRVVIVLSLVALGGRFGGPTWACAGAGAGFAIHSAITILIAGRATDLPVAGYLLGVARPLLPCIPMFLGVIALARGLAAAGAPLIASLAAQIAAGAVIYIAAAFVILRPSVDELLRLGRDAIRRRR